MQGEQKAQGGGGVGRKGTLTGDCGGGPLFSTPCLYLFVQHKRRRLCFTCEIRWKSMNTKRVVFCRDLTEESCHSKGD